MERGGPPLDCAGCGERGLPARSDFCLRCGASLRAYSYPRGGEGGAYTPAHLTAVLDRSDARQGERKEVTVLIVDVAGSLAMADALDPEDVHAVMDGFFALALEAVHREGGTVNQFRGDGLMALFGAPRARGDDPARGLRAALQIRQAAASYSESVRARHGLPFAIRIGINTGHVWVGAIGDSLRADYTAEGPTVGIAARLEEIASPGQILVGGETVARCGAYFELAGLGARSVRGVAEPVDVYELLAEGTHRARLSIERERGLTCFVGRGRELMALRRSLEPSSGVRFVEIWGEAGVGKSRLALEAVGGLPADITVLGMPCRESTSHRAYLPWLEVLRSWPEALPRTTAIDALLDLLEGREGAGAREVESALRSTLEPVLATRPVLIVVEDAHWLDPSSRLLVRRLAESPLAGSLAFLATLRDEGDSDWGASSGVERLDVAALPASDAQHLAISILGDLPEPEALADLVCRRAGGNPLFLEEVARALREGPDSLRETARMEAALARKPDRIPDTLHDVVAARIDALDEPVKHFLQAAAVLGEPFDCELLAEVECPVDGEPDAMIDELIERGLVRAQPDGLLDFCHGLVRGGAYGQLVRERRCALHRRAADALGKREKAETPDGASRIGSHYDKAGEPEEAIPHLHRAGSAYLKLEAPAEAAAHLRRAFELARSLPQRALARETAIGLELATALNILDQSGEASEVLGGLDPSDADQTDRKRVAQAWLQTGWLRFANAEDIAGGRALVERGLAIAEELPRGTGVAILGNSFLSRVLSLDGEPGPAALCARRMAELASGRGDHASLVAARHNECVALCDAGRVGEARRAAVDAESLARDSENDLAVSAARIAMARVHLFEGQPERALSATARGFEAGERAGQVGLLYNATLLRGYALALLGEAQGAARAFERLGEFNRTWPSTLLHRARGRLEVGDLVQAEELAQRCLARGGPATIAARAGALLGFARGLRRPGAPDAEALLRDAVRVCDEKGLRPYLAEAHGFLGELAAQAGDPQRAAYFAERAASGYESCGMPLHAQQVRTQAGGA